jgi:hypothetical protein
MNLVKWGHGNDISKTLRRVLPLVLIYQGNKSGIISPG